MKKYFILILLFLSSCDFKPDYHSPCWETPDCWRFTEVCEPMSECANIRWWEQFDDPILDSLIVQALQNNEDLQIATARLCEFYSLYLIVRSELFPQINMNASYERQKISIPNDFPFLDELPTIRNTFTLTMLLTYELDFWGKLRNATQAAFMEFLGQVAARRTVILSLVSSVATSYIQLRQYDLQYQISVRTVTERTEYYKLAKLRFEGGLTSEMEVMQAKAELDDAKVAVEEFEILIAQTENLISVLIGTNPSPILRGRSVDTLVYPPSIPVGLPSQIICNRPDVVQVEQELIAANSRIGEARARFLPSITLTGLYGYESNELRNLFSNNSKVWDFKVDASQPIYTGGRLSAELQLAKIRKLSLQHRYLLALQTAFKEVEDALIDHTESKVIRSIYEDQVKSMREYLKLAMLQYYEGLTDYLTVINAEQKLFNAELNLAQAQADVFITLVSLYKALGGGWVIDADECITIDYDNRGMGCCDGVSD